MCIRDRSWLKGGSVVAVALVALMDRSVVLSLVIRPLILYPEEVRAGLLNDVGEVQALDRQDFFFEQLSR
eukprot:3747407-Prorocentrum_lima.AAC.1